MTPHISVTVVFLTSRRGYYVRLRGWRRNDDGTFATDPATSAPVPLDTKEKIPDRVFTSATPPAPADRKTKRGDQVAAKWAAEQEAARNGVIAPVRRVMTLAEIATYWQRKHVTLRKAETLDRARKWQRALVRTKLEDVDGRGYTLNDVTPASIDVSHLEDYRDARLRACRTCGERDNEHGEKKHAHTAVSPRTCYNELAHVPQLLDFARERERETGVMHTRLTRIPEVRNRRGIYPKAKLAPEEYFRVHEALLQLEGGERYQLIFDFALNTGLRKHPLAAFDLAWYDPKARTIRVPASEMKGRGESYRELSVPISGWAASCLDRAAQGRRSGLAWASPSTGEEQDYFFHVERNVSTLATLPAKISLHAMRGTFNSWMANHRCERHTAEVPFFVREILMGHALPGQVEAYTKHGDAVLREAVDVFDCEWERYARSRENVVAFTRPAS